MRWVIPCGFLGLISASACGSGVAGTDTGLRVTTINVGPAGPRLVTLGATQQLTATVRDQNGNAMTGVAVTWSSSLVSVAAVSGED